MTTVQTLSSQAISNAAVGKWQEAKEKNEAIIELEPENIGALNRLAFCEMQLENFSKAKKIYESVLAVEAFNPIATKFVAMLKQKVRPVRVDSLSSHDEFIEEPGKTKSVSLQRLADPDVLQTLPTAISCKLVVKNHRVNVVTQAGTYVGSLPDDIAFRLQKLIGFGNTYVVRIQSSHKKGCIVFIKETLKSPTCTFAASFPLSSSNRSTSISEDVLLDEAPLDTRETGNEAEESDTEEPDPME